MPVNLKLVRLEKSPVEGVFGALLINNNLFCVTLELPDNGNKPKVSCIPAGTYKVAPFNSPKFGKTWQVTGVPNRNYILFHAGNTVADIEGCILLGEKFGKLKGRRAILNSAVTFTNFLKAVSAEKELTLTIIEV